MTKQKETRGGARENSGRKATGRLNRSITIYVNEETALALKGNASEIVENLVKEHLIKPSPLPALAMPLDSPIGKSTPD